MSESEMIVLCTFDKLRKESFHHSIINASELKQIGHKKPFRSFKLFSLRFVTLRSLLAIQDQNSLQSIINSSKTKLIALSQIWLQRPRIWFIFDQFISIFKAVVFSYRASHQINYVSRHTRVYFRIHFRVFTDQSCALKSNDKGQYPTYPI